MEDGNGNDNATNCDFFIGRLGKNKRAARTYEQVRDILCKTTGSWKQPRRRGQHEPHKFAYPTVKKKKNFARFARAFFIFAHLVDFLVLMKWPNLRLSGRENFVAVFLFRKRWFNLIPG